MCEELGTLSIRICQEGHANSLCLNKESTQIAVAGRSLLRVYAIDGDGFAEVCNMRGGKNPKNLSYSSNDVAWSLLDSNILATAATNGVVSVWDLSRFGRQKQLMVFNEHQRTAHTVTFHSSEPHVLISGSQDGTIKCFDTRVEKSTNTYFSNSESVRDIKFSPHTTNIFSAVSENGNVHIWDYRKSDKCIVQFAAHSGPIYTCDWHPTKNWLATGSRDKLIKVWNMDAKGALEDTIHTIAAVGRVKWRPERTYHIASCALVSDYSIHVWDIRRPYIPFASFNEHSNVTTGIAWKGGDADCLLSTSKDSTIYKHAFRDASRPALRSNIQGAGVGRNGDISFANKIKVFTPVTAAQVVRSNSYIMRQNQMSSVEQFHIAQSDMHHFLMGSSHTGYLENDSEVNLKEHESFIGCAKEMILSGKKLSDICEHNASVTKKYGKHNATTLWHFIKVLYGSTEFSNQTSEHRNSCSTQKSSQTSRRTTQVANDASQSHSQQSEQGDESGNNDESSNETQDSDSVSIAISSNSGGMQNYPPQSSVILSETQVLTEITFENFDLLREGFIFVGPPDYNKTLQFPDTALHHDVQAARPQLDITAENRERASHNISNLLKVTNLPTVPLWEPHKFVADSLMLQGDVGDVQTALAVLIVVGDTRKFLAIEEILVEHWFHTYIDQLHRLQLWNEACEVINLSWMRSIRDLNQHSTTVHTNCGECGRMLSRNNGWFCPKCKSIESAICCVCGMVVRGLYAWCQGCSHGGHLEHVMEYFANRSKCPKCGHLCEYN